MLSHPKIMIVQWTISTHFHSNVSNHRMVYLVANEGEFNMNPPSTSPHACDLNSTLSTSWWDCSFMHSLQIVKTITNVQTIHHILPIYVIIIIGKKANTLHLDLHYKKIFINVLMAIEFSTTCSYIVCIARHHQQKTQDLRLVFTTSFQSHATFYNYFAVSRIRQVASDKQL